MNLIYPGTELDEHDVTKVFLAYLNALAAMDYSAASKCLTESVRADLILFARMILGIRRSCSGALRRIMSSADHGVMCQRFLSVKINYIEIKNGFASIAVVGMACQPRLCKTPVGWKICRLAAW